MLTGMVSFCVLLGPDASDCIDLKTALTMNENILFHR